MSKCVKRNETDGLIAELERARAQQAATQEILESISKNRHDEALVFDVILENAAKLCCAPHAGLLLRDDEDKYLNLVAMNSAQSGYAEYLKANPHSMDDETSLTVEAVRAMAVRQYPDIEALAGGNVISEQLRNTWKLERMRTLLYVPLIKGGRAIGVIGLYRLHVEEFTDNDIEILKVFASQAVIAIDNVRHFRELQTLLERERASTEVLEVISKSRDDDQPVFEVILEQAARLCQSPQAGLIMTDEQRTIATYAAFWGAPSKHFEPGVTTWSLDSPIAITTAIREGRVVNVADTENDEDTRSEHPDRQEIVAKEEIRSVLAVPLMQGDVAIGCIDVYRREVNPFTDEDVRLLENFAAQAVIAIENVRQFREVQTRLEREAATGEVLSVISRSRSDAQPVFSTILENAARLCSAPHAMLLLRDQTDEHLVLEASNAAKSAFIDQLRETPHRLDNEASYAVRAVKEKRALHIPDLRVAKPASGHVPQIKVALDLEGMRTVLLVPLQQGDTAIGVIALYKLEVAPFTDDQIKLVETFAAQAVIAIENTKQLQTLEALNAELGERVDEQVHEIERMGRLKRFLPSAVADAVVSSGDESMLTSHRALVATLFCDIRGFTAFCESAEPEETIEVLQTYHQEMSNLIDEHGGGVDQRAGDGIMVIFNDPIAVDDPAGDAVCLAVAMRKKMRELCVNWKKLGHRLGFGIGISYGYATVGIVGSEGRFDYTASGTAINTAARLCDLAENDDILISPRTWAAVDGDFEAESRGEIQMKGIREPVEVFAVLAE